MLQFTTTDSNLLKIADAILSNGILTNEAYVVIEEPVAVQEAKEYRDELFKRLKESGLGKRQKAILNTLEDACCTETAEEVTSGVLYGMQVYAAISAMIANPKRLSDFINARCSNIRDIYPVREVS